jgi:(p)ppGpp synthase/HD superfamily hydrolase
MPITDRFADALAYAERLHRAQTRKGNDIPYIAHLMAVCATVLEWGGGEDVAIAALLHDAVEDQGGLKTLNEIIDKFGSAVGEIVAACSDSVASDASQKAPWLERKQKHLEHLRSVDRAVALVTAADKLHNLRAQIRDVRRLGANTMTRFNASPAQIICYNREIAIAIAKYRDSAPIGELEEATTILAHLLGVEAPA